MAKEFNAVKDSGQRQEFQTGAVRDIQVGKGRFDLVPPYALFRLTRHFENGISKYPERNWEKGIPLSKFLNSAIRHLYKHLSSYNDEDHLAAAAWNIFALIDTEKRINDGLLPKNLNDLPLNGTKWESS